MAQPRRAELVAARATRAIGVLVAGVLFSSICGASPADLFGSGTRSRAMGGSGAAHPASKRAVNPHETLTNPASLGSAQSKVVTAGYSAVRFTSTASVPVFEGRSSTAIVGAGLVVPFTLRGALQDRLTLGFSANVPGSVISRVRILDPARPQFPLLNNRAESLNMALALGANLPWDLRLGLGVMTLADLHGTISINAGGSGTVSSLRDDKLQLSPAMLVGLQWSPLEDWAIGAAWRGELSSRFDLIVDVQDLGQVLVPPLNITGLTQYDPAQLQLEVAHQEDGFLVALGATWKQWSGLRRFKDATVRCSEEQPDCAAPKAPTVTASNTIVPRLGLEYSLKVAAETQLTFRSGYFFEPTPLPAQQGDTNWFDNDRHALTLGYALQVGAEAPVILGLSYQHHWQVSRTHQKSDAQSNEPNSITTGGSVDLVALELEIGF